MKIRSVRFWRDAERGDQIKEQHRERGIDADAQEERFYEIDIIAQAAQVVEPGDVEDDDPQHENNREGDGVGVPELRRKNRRHSG